MEAVGSSDKYLSSYKTALRHNVDQSTLH